MLHIKRSSGSTEVLELPATGDHVLVPHGLLDSEDVLGFDVEVAGCDCRDPGGEAGGSRHDGRDPCGGGP